MPRLLLPITLVRDSFFDGETEAASRKGCPTAWLEKAAADIVGFVSAP